MANLELIQGVASLLQQASAALARLGEAPQQTTRLAQPAPALLQSSQDKLGDGASASLAGAVAALAQVAAQLGNAGAVGDGVGDGLGGGMGDGRYTVAPDGPDAAISTADFCAQYQLEAWVGEMLDLLAPGQRAAVMDPPLNTSNARNLNGIVISRIKQVVPLDQRLGIFVQINGLSEGVVDRLGTLNAEQAEAVMESGMKIQKASNPSGVAMRRITDALRSSRQGNSAFGSSFRHGLSGAGLGGSRGERPGGGPGAGVWGDASRRQDRSRTPGPQRHSNGHSSGNMPEDVQAFVESQGLEWWCGEVLKRLSLWQRQQITKDVQVVQGVRNPSGVVMSRVRQFVDTSELMTIFIDLNQVDSATQSQLWALTPEQQAAVISPGIYLQNVRNPSTAVRSRINNVLAGKDAFGKPLSIEGGG